MKKCVECDREREEGGLLCKECREWNERMSNEHRSRICPDCGEEVEWCCASNGLYDEEKFVCIECGTSFPYYFAIKLPLYKEGRK